MSNHVYVNKTTAGLHLPDLMYRSGQRKYSVTFGPGDQKDLVEDFGLTPEQIALSSHLRWAVERKMLTRLDEQVEDKVVAVPTSISGPPKEPEVTANIEVKIEPGNAGVHIVPGDEGDPEPKDKGPMPDGSVSAGPGKSILVDEESMKQVSAKKLLAWIEQYHPDKYPQGRKTKKDVLLIISSDLGVKEISEDELG